MKRISFIMAMFALCVGSAWTQKYHPFVEEGKEWVVLCGNGFIHLRIYTMKGDTVINGTIWKKSGCRFYSRREDYREYSSYSCFFREEDGKVYYLPEYDSIQCYLYDYDLNKTVDRFYVKQDSVGFLFMDMNLEEGDTCNTWSMWPGTTGMQYYPKSTAYKVEWVEYNGQVRKKINMKYAKKGMTWVEGIASFNGYPWENDGDLDWGDVAYLVLCRTPNEVLYKGDYYYDEAIEFYENLKLSIRVPQREENPMLHDLQGRRLTAEPRHGVFIKDGRKVMK